MKTKYINPEVGRIYTMRQGGNYRCLKVLNADQAEKGECVVTLFRDKDGWELTAVGLQESRNGTVEWDCSFGGHWGTGIA